MSAHEQAPAKGRSTADRVFYALVAVCIVLTVADFMVHKHTHFAFEEWPLFYALVGFVSYVSLVFTAKGLRKILMRPENYYGEAEVAVPLVRHVHVAHADHDHERDRADDDQELAAPVEQGAEE